jgi:hypothetical protein
MKKLPIGIQTFSEIIEQGYTYVDKTGHALAMAQQGKYWFLSRPRRFGKSLFVDTLKELFEGNEPLFRGLAIHEQWDWSRRYPVIKLDFSAGVVQSRAELDQRIYHLLEENERRLGIECPKGKNDIPGSFSDLISFLYAQTGQPVVILVDEYDKPILDNIDHPEVAAEVREGMKNLYSAMKGQDAHIRFAFVTGVTKFSKVSLFSGLNQLRDLTLSPSFATICGYTQGDLESTFAEHLAGVDWERLKAWYNGYNFLGEPVYNPFDILLFIGEDHAYRNYWFETGSPSFLIKLFQRRRYFVPDLESQEVTEELLDSFDVERINPVTLLYQTGYLTLAESYNHLGEWVYRLRIPNQEVRIALHNQIIHGYTDIVERRLFYKGGLYEALAQADLDGLIAAIKRLFAAIPWRNFTGNDLADAEGYYASVLYAFFASMNAEIIPEDISNHGQVDLTLKFAEYIYVVEIKLERNGETANTERPNPALQQIEARGYSDKYRQAPGKGLFELGLVFGAEERNLVRADWRPIRPDSHPSNKAI